MSKVKQIDFYTKINDTDIFIVVVDDIPLFYCDSLEQARDQCEDYLNNLPKDYSNYEYFLTENENGNQFTLTSTYRFGWFKTEKTENVSNIYVIPKIQFVNYTKLD